MEKFFKRYFWVVNLLTLALCAFFAAKAVNAFVESYLRRNDKPAKVQPAEAPKPKAQAADQPVAIKSTFNPFTGQSMEPPKTTGPEANAEPLVPVSDDPRDYTDKTDCNPTGLPGTLVGTIASTDPRASFALIQEGDNKIHMYEVGRELQGGARILAVVRHKVFVVNGGRVECYLHGEAKAAAKPKTDATADAGQGGDGIRKVSESEFIVSNTELQKALENMSQLSTQARMVPSFKDGQPNGFRIYSIQPGSLYQKIGIKNGDVIQRINGMDLNTPEKGLEILTKLRTEKRITVDMLRNNAKSTLDYTIQ